MLPPIWARFSKTSTRLPSTLAKRSATTSAGKTGADDYDFWFHLILLLWSVLIHRFVIVLIIALQDVLPPFAVSQIPLDRLRNSGFKVYFGFQPSSVLFW